MKGFSSSLETDDSNISGEFRSIPPRVFNRTFHSTSTPHVMDFLCPSLCGCWKLKGPSNHWNFGECHVFNSGRFAMVFVSLRSYIGHEYRVESLCRSARVDMGCRAESIPPVCETCWQKQGASQWGTERNNTRIDTWHTIVQGRMWSSFSSLLRREAEKMRWPKIAPSNVSEWSEFGFRAPTGHMISKPTRNMDRFFSRVGSSIFYHANILLSCRFHTV